MSYVCVWPNGMHCPKEYLQVMADDLPVDQCATVKLRSDEDYSDAAHRHIKAEARYFASL